jgi:hypothetical protein
MLPWVMPVDHGAYAAAFEIVERDLERALEYVEPTDGNLDTYSHRLYELLLRACTEFESLCKDALISQGATKNPRDMNVNDYVALDQTLGLGAREVGYLFWRPEIAYEKPFDGWTVNRPPLGWYAAYNQVKHNRATAFANASLRNVRLALAALFVMLDAMKIVVAGNAVGGTERYAKGGKTIRERFSPGSPFSLII